MVFSVVLSINVFLPLYSTNWPEYMYAGMRAYPDPYGPLVGFFFFVVLQVLL